MPNPASVPTPLQLYRQMVNAPANESLRATRMRGYADAPILLVAPPMDGTEYGNNLPFSNEAAEEFHSILMDHAGLDTDNGMLVVSCNLYSLKANKASVAQILDYVTACGRYKLFKYYICVGVAAFKHIFGYGKNPSMVSLAGNIVYVPQTGHTPLFVFPDINFLVVDPDDEVNSDYWKKRKVDECARQISLLSKKLGRDLRDRKIIR